MEDKSHTWASFRARLPGSESEFSQFNLPTCITHLRSCTLLKTLISGQIVHDHIIRCGHHHSSLVGTLILQFYLTCGALRDALRWFLHIPRLNAYPWNLMIGAFVQQGDYFEALHHYQRMQQDGVLADQATYVHMLSACTVIEEGLQIYANIRLNGFDSDTIVGTALVSMFGRLRNLEDVDAVFDRISFRNIISWNAVMSAHIQNGQGWKVLFLFNECQQEGLLPDKISFLNMLTALAGNQVSQFDCKRLHLLAICGGCISDNVVRTALICAYGSCGYMNDAILSFLEMQERGVVSWNAMIMLQEGNFSEAFATFYQMQLEGIFPDNVTFITLLDICSRHTCLEQGKKMHLILRHGVLALDVVLSTALINMYGKCGKLHTARHLFSIMQTKNVVSWNTIITCYIHCGNWGEALQLFYRMQHEALTPNKVTVIEVFSACGGQTALTIGKNLHSCILQSPINTDPDVGSSLISMYGKCGNAKDAQHAFNTMCTHKTSTWNALIATHAQLGDAKEAGHLFEKMKIEGVVVDDITFVSILAACGRDGLLDEAFYYFALMPKVHLLAHTAEHYDCMIDLLCRTGLFDHAAYLIKEMPFEPTVISWTSLFCAYGMGLER
ncbi:hypothetical protein L7F22_068993 [Adiantum nelumboides]|nr:hypothetical protein [Adiantum nelumboides]